MYKKRWLRKASESFIQQNYGNAFAWKEMFKKRILVEKKYCTKNETQKSKDIYEDWKWYFTKGVELSEKRLPDPEFITVITIEEENYKSAAAIILQQKPNMKDLSITGSLYYKWARCLYFLAQTKKGTERLQFLKRQESKYQSAIEIDPYWGFLYYLLGKNISSQIDLLEDDETTDAVELVYYRFA